MLEIILYILLGLVYGVGGTIVLFNLLFQEYPTGYALLNAIFWPLRFLWLGLRFVAKKIFRL
jgi:hypothetical protein